MIVSPVVPQNACPRCNVNELLEDDSDGVCASCAFFGHEDHEIYAFTDRRMKHRFGPAATAIRERVNAHVAFDRAPEFVSLDTMHPLFYGGDIDTLNNLIDFECID